MLFSLLMLSSLFFAALVAGVSAAKGEQLTPPLPSFGNGCIDKRAEDIYKMLTEEPSQIILLDVRTEAEYEEEHIQIENEKHSSFRDRRATQRAEQVKSADCLLQKWCEKQAGMRDSCATQLHRLQLGRRNNCMEGCGLPYNCIHATISDTCPDADTNADADATRSDATRTYRE